MQKYFHGSKADIKSFNISGTGKHGTGYYFTKSYSDARSFSYLLAGRSEDQEKTPKVYTVLLSVKNPFDTMSVEHAQMVANHYGFKFRISKNAGGAKEHYHHLANQLVSRGFATKETVNDAIKKAGFDSIYCEFFEHIIAFDEGQIEVISAEEV